MSERLWPALTALFGLATLAAFLNFLGVQNEWGFAELGPQLGAFQRADAQDNLASLLADGAEAQAMHAVNRWDLFAFIPAYTLFLVAGAIWLGGVRDPATWLAIAAALAGAGADWIETSRQLDVTRPFLDIPPQALLAGSVGVDIEPWHWSKYVALGVNAWAIAALCLMRARKRWVLGALALLPLPVVAAAYFSYFPFNLIFVPFWIALIAAAIKDAVRAKGA